MRGNAKQYGKHQMIRFDNSLCSICTSSILISISQTNSPTKILASFEINTGLPASAMWPNFQLLLNSGGDVKIFSN